jgi:hypothetical protein
LNQQGEDFVSGGYRLEGVEPVNTFPFAVWLSGQVEDSQKQDLAGYANRVELVSGGPIAESGLYYFIESRLLSLGLQSDGKLQDRSGRFEDMFVSYQIEDFTATVGQFRPLAQEDVSRRLSVSEPVSLSASLPGKPKAGDKRLSRLRAFSPAGRSPALRLSYYMPSHSDKTISRGWYAGVTVPFSGELSFPLSEEALQEASFELEGRPKGAFFETYYRSGLSSVGLHGFAGDNQRWLAHFIGTYNWSSFFSTLAFGVANADEKGEFRASWTNEVVPLQWVAAGVRYDQRKEEGKDSDPIISSYINLQFPASQLTFVLRLEQRIQKDNNRSVAEFSFIF